MMSFTELETQALGAIADGLAARMASRAAVTRAVGVITAVSFLVWFIG